MAAPRTPANQRQRTWRAQAAQPEQKIRRRRVFRVLLPLAGICLLGVLAWVLVEWILRAPKLQLVAIRVADYGNPEVPTIPYCFEDIEALRTVLDAEGSGQASTWSGADSEGFAQLRNALSAKTSSRDNLLVYIKAHGVSINGTAYLLDVDFALSDGAAGRLSIADVLKYIADSPARLKLVALDTGHMESDAQLGMLTNEFTHLLTQAVEGMPAQSNVWVLTSNSLFERTLVSHKDRRSAFAYYLAEGLNGKADGVLFEEDKEKVADRLIQLDELFHFVRGYVGQYARVTTDDQQAQTPMLLRAGTGEVARPPHEVLLRIEKPEANESTEEEKKTVAVHGPGFIGENVGAYNGREGVAANGRTTWRSPLGALVLTGGLALVGNQAPSEAAKKDSAKAAPMQPAAAPTAQDTDLQAPTASDKEAKTDVKEGAQATKEDAKKKAEPKAAEPAKESPAAGPKDQSQKPVAAVRSPVEARLFEYEKWFFEQNGGGKNWRPIDYAPGLARLFYESLAGCRERDLAGQLFANSQYFQNSLNGKLNQLQALKDDITARQKVFQSGVARPTYERDQQVHAAIQLRNDACHLLPLLIRQYTVVSAEIEPTIKLDLLRLIEATGNLDRRLAIAPTPQQAGAPQAFEKWKQGVVSEAAQVKGQVDKLRADFQARYDKQQALIAKSGNPTLSRGLADLAQTPLATPERREELNRAARSEKIALGFAEVEKLGSVPPRLLPSAEQRRLADLGWTRAVARAELELALAGLVLGGEVDAKSSTAQQAFAAIGQTTDDNARLAEVRKIDEFLYSVYRRVPERAAERLRSKDYSDSRAAETAIRLADARDRIDKVLSDRAVPDPIAQLRLLAVPELTREYSLTLGESGNGPLALNFGVGEKLAVRFVSNAALPGRLRLELKYNPTRLQVKDTQGAVLGSDNIREFALPPGGSNSASEHRIELQLEARDQLGERTNLNLRWLDERNRELAKGAILLAHPVPVVAKLAVYGPPYTANHTWQKTPDGESYFEVPFSEGIAHVRLQPFSGHETQYQFRLTNTAKYQKRYKVAVYSVPKLDGAAPRPGLAAMISAAQSSNILLASNVLTIDPGQTSSIRFDSPPPAAAKDTAADAAKAATEKAAAAKTPPPDVRAGLVCVLTEISKTAAADKSPASGQQVIVIEPEVQPPHFYITPRVVYRDGEIAAVLNVPEDVNRLPIEGANVRLEVFSDQLVNDAHSKFATTITRKNRNGDTLRAFVRGGTPSAAQVALHVDDYPRAMIYELPLDASLQDVPRKLDLSEIRLPDETEFPVYLDGRVREPVKFPFRVDLPPNTDRSYRVRVFISATPSGDFEPGTVMFEQFEDRAHRIEFVKVEGAPVLALRAHTGDLVADLDLDAYENQPLYVRVQLVGQRQGEETVLADKFVKIYLDGKAPTVEILRPARDVYEKVPFTVRLDPRDDISGIKQVEYALDKQPNPDPKAANKEVLVKPDSKGIRLAGGVYQLTHVFEKPGPQTLYVQATDMRGNKSEIAERLISVRPTPTVVDKGVEVPVAKLGRITGRAGLPPGVGGKVDVVILRDAGGGEYAQTKPKDDGSYAFENLPPGKYSVEGKGTIAGNFSKPAPKSVNVEAGKTAPIDVLLSR